MNFFSSTLAFLLAIAPVAVHSHATGYRYCQTPSGDLRFFVRNTHGAQDNYADNAPNMIYQKQGESPVSVLPTGELIDVSPRNLPGCGTNPIVNPELDCPTVNNWIYFDIAGLVIDPCVQEVTFSVGNSVGNSNLFANRCGIFPTTLTCPSTPVHTDSPTTTTVPSSSPSLVPSGTTKSAKNVWRCDRIANGADPDTLKSCKKTKAPSINV